MQFRKNKKNKIKIKRKNNNNKIQKRYNKYNKFSIKNSGIYYIIHFNYFQIMLKEIRL